ncbi:prolyl oligopeptidase family serine peptidase, partial [Prochlorococcus sp. AH-716-K03]|nr:prolyl oligopeptidase family serine peptidase [Prochlorococcus sp. AH-716-K03]
MSNAKNLKIKQRETKKISFKELSLINNMIFWIDNINDDPMDKNAIFARPFNDKYAIPQQLTGDNFYIKSNFHGYGGKSYQCIEVHDQIYLIWVDQLSKALWLKILKVRKLVPKNDNEYLLCDTEPIQLTKSIEINFDTSFVISKNSLLYGLCEIKNIDYLFSLSLKKTLQEIRKIKKFDNFVGNLSSNTSANLFSWVEWDTASMPWERNELFIASIDKDGEIQKIKKFSNNLINENKNVSFFQPYWMSDNVLVCSEDSTGWWNLLFLEVTNIKNIILKKRIIKPLTEYGSPQWVSGISLVSGNIKNLFCVAKKENSWLLEHYQNCECIKELKLPFCSISDLDVYDQKLVIRGSSFGSIDDLFECDFEAKSPNKLFNEISFESVNEYVRPESFWFKGFNNQSTHSFIYKPLFERFIKSPLIVKAHSGPTACFDGSLNSEVQYWISRGFTVAEVNYGGSSGFGREYRERLNYKWGIIDSYDCKALVIDLIRLNLVDRTKVAILGNSAGGLTAVNSLCEGDFFKVAICKYPVLDLNDMHHKTHRFEKGYLNSLIGEYSKFRNEYKFRSPIYKINQLKKPVLLFHGKKDLVISYKKTLQI